MGRRRDATALPPSRLPLVVLSLSSIVACTTLELVLLEIGSIDSEIRRVGFRLVQQSVGVLGIAALAGLLGTISDSRFLVRIYAISTTLELVWILISFLTAALLTFFLPSTTANPISEAICETITRGELATQTYWRQESRLGLRGIQIVNYGVETCDEMLEKRIAILGGLALLVAVKFWGAGLLWGYENWLRDERRRNEGWEEDGFDLRDMKKGKGRSANEGGPGRSRRMSSASLTRSTSGSESTTRHGRRKSHSLSHPPLSSVTSQRPRLVLSPSLQSSLPSSTRTSSPTVSSPIRPNFISSSSSSATPTPPPRRSRRSSLPPARPQYPTTSTPPNRRPTISEAPSRYRAGSTSSRSRSDNDADALSVKSERQKE